MDLFVRTLNRLEQSDNEDVGKLGFQLDEFNMPSVVHHLVVNFRGIYNRESNLSQSPQESMYGLQIVKTGLQSMLDNKQYGCSESPLSPRRTRKSIERVINTIDEVMHEAAKEITKIEREVTGLVEEVHT